jgi:DNA-binding NarL/FixJ family response regulator
MSDQSDRERIRLVLLDDHLLFREGLVRLLASEPGFELVADCGAPSEALEALNGATVDVVLVNLRLANIRHKNGDGFISAARRAGYPGNFLIVTSDIDAAASALAIKRGASGVFSESKSSTRLIQAIRMVADGEVWIDQSVMRLMADRYPQHEVGQWSGLTEREGAVLQGVLEGLTNKRIGNRLAASESAIKATIQQLFSKTGVRTRSQLVRAALEGALGADAKPMADIRKVSAAAEAT